MKKILFFILLCSTLLVGGSFANAATGTISVTNKSAKILTSGDAILWRTTNGAAVSITDSVLTGDIWGPTIGWIRLNPGGGQGGVTNTTAGVLGGYAWGENAGWINFAPTQGGVSIDSNGQFDGYAWSQNYGWIQFDCGVVGACVETDWRPSSASVACNDGVDNDSDGSTDYPSDTNCAGPTDDSEAGPTTGECDAQAGGCDWYDYCPDIAGIQNDASLCQGTPIDYCPAIPGTQASPDECPPPQPTDYCPNIPGIQNSTSQCPSPSDVCPDIAGVQTDPGLCPQIPIDYCPDIAGIQSSFAQCPPPTDCEADGTCPPAPTCQELGTCPPQECVGPDCVPPPPTTCETETDVFGQVICIIKDSILTTKDTIKDVFNQIKQIIGTDEDILTKIIGIVGLIAGGFFTLVPVLFGNPLSFAELILVPYRLWSLLMTAFGLKKRTRPWGTVYDAITKQPLDPAVVTLTNQAGEVIATSITDIDGRYGFLVPPGTYTISAKKTHYAFPSRKLIGRTRDEIYLDLYFGTPIEVKQEGEVITKNIPLDPLNFDWNEFAKREQGRMKFYKMRDIWLARISDFLFSFGLLFSFLAIISAPKTYNIVIFCIYLLMLTLKEVGLRTHPSGQMMERATGKPFSFGVLRVYSIGTNVEIATRVADRLGKYYCLIQNGTYNVTLERKNMDQTYTPIASIPQVEVTKGFINRTFKI